MGLNDSDIAVMSAVVTGEELSFLRERYTTIRRGDAEVCAAVVRAVCETFEIERDVLLSESRTAIVSEARDCAAFLLRERTWTYEEIGRALGRDWNSMRAAVQRMRNRMKQKRLRDTVANTRGQVGDK